MNREIYSLSDKNKKSNVILFLQSDDNIGYSARSNKSEGPENEIVLNFLSAIKNKFDSSCSNYALFLEPCLETGFPDIVIVQFKRSIYNSNWNYNRNKITKGDLKVLNQIISTKGVLAKDLVSLLGLNESSLKKSLASLSEAGLVYQSSNHLWHNKALKTIWGIQKITAIEAKIKDCSSAVSQAEMNAWFANESLVLFPCHRISERIISIVSEKGLGVFVIDQKKRVKNLVKPFGSNGPCSYASWLFNEWIGRRIYAMGGYNDTL